MARLSLRHWGCVPVDAIPADARHAMWLTGLMSGLRPGGLAGLRWYFVDIDSESPSIRVIERSLEVDDRYAGQVEPKTPRSRRTIGLHPLLVAALHRHREEMRMLRLYDDEGFVFCSRNGTAMTLSNLRRAFRQLCERAASGNLLVGTGSPAGLGYAYNSRARPVPGAVGGRPPAESFNSSLPRYRPIRH